MSAVKVKVTNVFDEFFLISMLQRVLQGNSYKDLFISIVLFASFASTDTIGIFSSTFMMADIF